VDNGRSQPPTYLTANRDIAEAIVKWGYNLDRL
jgi:hypothetical protein